MFEGSYVGGPHLTLKLVELLAKVVEPVTESDFTHIQSLPPSVKGTFSGCFGFMNILPNQRGTLQKNPFFAVWFSVLIG
jgi:hypothetical protein